MKKIKFESKKKFVTEFENGGIFWSVKKSGFLRLTWEGKRRNSLKKHLIPTG